MEIYYLPKFAQQYKKLPKHIQDKAEEKELLFRKDPFHPQLRTHKLGGLLSDFWAFSITRSHRIIFEFVDQKTVRFYQIGNHSIYK